MSGCVEFGHGRMKDEDNFLPLLLRDHWGCKAVAQAAQCPAGHRGAHTRGVSVTAPCSRSPHMPSMLFIFPLPSALQPFTPYQPTPHRSAALGRRALDSAFQDLSALMASAATMVALAEKFRGVLHKEGSSGSGGGAREQGAGCWAQLGQGCDLIMMTGCDGRKGLLGGGSKGARVLWGSNFLKSRHQMVFVTYLIFQRHPEAQGYNLVKAVS